MLITKSLALQFAGKYANETFTRSNINEKSYKLKSEIDKIKALDSYDIFLSNRKMDDVYVYGIMKLLESYNYTVYVDWVVNPELDRTNVTNKTIDHIKNIMDKSKSLVYLVSENSVDSKWMPWELGYMHGKKEMCAILPIVDNSNVSDYKGLEYLGYYPYIDRRGYESNPEKKVLWLYNKTGYVNFDSWLKDNKKPYTH